MRNVTISELKDTIKKLYSLANPPTKEGTALYVSAMIWGPPGVGKSAGVRQAAEELKVGFIDLRLSLLNPVDLRGLPTVNKEAHQAEWLPPEFLPHKGKGILFLDEINLAPQSVMAAGYQLILDRRLGDYQVPDGWIIIAAGNRTQDTSNTTKMPPPLANRFIHLEVNNPDDKEWRDWAVKAGVHEQVVAFISKMPAKLFIAPTITDKAWCSPRSWEFASALHSIGENVDSAVGQGAGSEFRAFLNVYQRIPDIDKILAGEKVEIPKANELDILWATCMSLLYRANPKQWDNVYKFLEKIPKEFTVLMLQMFHDKTPEWTAKVRYSPQFDKFCKENPEIFGD